MKKIKENIFVLKCNQWNLFYWFFLYIYIPVYLVAPRHKTLFDCFPDRQGYFILGEN